MFKLLMDLSYVNLSNPHLNLGNFSASKTVIPNLFCHNLLLGAKCGGGGLEVEKLPAHGAACPLGMALPALPPQLSFGSTALKQ